MSITRDDWQDKQFQLASSLAVATADDTLCAAKANEMAEDIMIGVYGEKPEEPEEPEEVMITAPHVYTADDFIIGDMYRIEAAGQSYKGIVNDFISETLVLLQNGGMLLEAGDQYTRVMIKLSDITVVTSLAFMKSENDDDS